MAGDFVLGNLQLKVAKVENEAKHCRHKAEQCERRKKDVEREARSLFEQMGFREKYLGGLFGGNKELIARRRGLLREAEDCAQKAIELTVQAKNLASSVVDVVSSHLSGTNAEFKDLLLRRDAAYEAKRATDSYLQKIDGAIEEVREAESMENMDLFTKSKWVSLMSHQAVSEAKDAMNRVRRATASFRRAISEYNDFRGEPKKDADEYLEGDVGDVDDTFDLMLDLAFDGFDFGSLATISSLNDAKNKLERLRSKVLRNKKLIDGLHSELGEIVQHKICKALKACE